MSPIANAVRVSLLLLNLFATSHAAHALLAPLFGRTFGEMLFHFGVFVAMFLGCVVPVSSPSAQRASLRIAAAFQVATAVFSKVAGAKSAATWPDSPTFAALVVHSVLGWPAISFAGAVGLRWTVRISSCLPPYPISSLSLSPPPPLPSNFLPLTLTPPNISFLTFP